MAGHPDIHTVSEPWLALSPLFALRDEGLAADYNPVLGRNALKDFLQHLPEGETAYWDAVRLMLDHLYGRSLAQAGKSIFLDKTPRYYFVIPQLRQLYPDAKFVFLLRNPLAVFSSILETWIKNEDVDRLRDHWHDLLTAPQCLLDGIRSFNSNGIVVRYEEVVSAPAVAIRNLCDGLGVGFSPNMVEYGSMTDGTRWLCGDQGTVYEETRPIEGRVERWRKVLATSQVWHSWAGSYLSTLGRELISEMGYDYESLNEGFPKVPSSLDWIGPRPSFSQNVVSDLRRRVVTFEKAADERLLALREKEQELQRLNDELGARLTVIDELHVQVKTFEQTATEGLLALREKEEELQRLNAELIARLAVIHELQRQGKTFELAADERLIALREKEEELQHQNSELGSRLAVIHELQKQVTTFQRAADERLIALQEKEQELQRQNAELTARLTVITELQRQVTTFERAADERLVALREKDEEV